MPESNIQGTAEGGKLQFGESGIPRNCCHYLLPAKTETEHSNNAQNMVRNDICNHGLSQNKQTESNEK